MMTTTTTTQQALLALANNDNSTPISVSPSYSESTGNSMILTEKQNNEDNDDDDDDDFLALPTKKAKKATFPIGCRVVLCLLPANNGIICTNQDGHIIYKKATHDGTVHISTTTPSALYGTVHQVGLRVCCKDRSENWYQIELSANNPCNDASPSFVNASSKGICNNSKTMICCREQDLQFVPLTPVWLQLPSRFENGSRKPREAWIISGERHLREIHTTKGRGETAGNSSHNGRGDVTSSYTVQIVEGEQVKAGTPNKATTYYNVRLEHLKARLILTAPMVHITDKSNSITKQHGEAKTEASSLDQTNPSNLDHEEVALKNTNPAMENSLDQKPTKPKLRIKLKIPNVLKALPLDQKHVSPLSADEQSATRQEPSAVILKSVLSTTVPRFSSAKAIKNITNDSMALAVRIQEATTATITTTATVDTATTSNSIDNTTLSAILATVGGLTGPNDAAGSVDSANRTAVAKPNILLGSLDDSKTTSMEEKREVLPLKIPRKRSSPSPPSGDLLSASLGRDLQGNTKKPRVLSATVAHATAGTGPFRLAPPVGVSRVYSSQLELPSFFGMTFLQKTLKGKGNYISNALGKAFGCTLEWKGTLIPCDCPSYTGSSPFCVEIIGSNKKSTLECRLEMKRILYSACHPSVRGNLVWNLAQLNRWGNKGKGIYCVPPDPHFPGNRKFMTSMLANGSSCSFNIAGCMERAHQHALTIADLHPSCEIQVRGKCKEHPYVNEHVYICGPNFDDVYYCREDMHALIASPRALRKIE